LKFSQQLRLDEGSLLFSQMSRGWDAAMHAAFEKLPPFPWEAPS
jgi:predicted proteasome-type protease